MTFGIVAVYAVYKSRHTIYLIDLLAVKLWYAIAIAIAIARAIAIAIAIARAIAIAYSKEPADILF